MVIQNMACTYVQTPVCRNGDYWSLNVAPRCEQRFGERISGFGWHYAPEVQCSAGKGDPVSKKQEDRNRPGNDGGLKLIISSEQVKTISQLRESLEREEKIKNTTLQRLIALNTKNNELVKEIDTLKTENNRLYSNLESLLTSCDERLHKKDNLVQELEEKLKHTKEAQDTLDVKDTEHLQIDHSITDETDDKHNTMEQNLTLLRLTNENKRLHEKITQQEQTIKRYEKNIKDKEKKNKEQKNEMKRQGVPRGRTNKK